jgi:hypothetical protein
VIIFQILLEVEKIHHYHEVMVDKPSFPDPNKPPVNSPTPPNAPKPFGEKESSGWNPKPLHWLGMTFDSKQTKMLWNMISQNIGNQIKKEQDRAVKAIKKLNPENGDSDDS